MTQRQNNIIKKIILTTLIITKAYTWEFNVWTERKGQPRLYIVEDTAQNNLFVIPPEKSLSTNKFYDFGEDDKSLTMKITSDHLIYMTVVKIEMSEFGKRFNQNFDYQISKDANKTLMPGETHSFDITYDCNSKKSWGRVEIILQGKVLVSGERFVYEIGYNKICNSLTLRASDLSYFPLLAFVMLVLYKVSTNVNEENYENRGGYSAGINVFHLTLFAGSGILTTLSALLAPNGNYSFVKGCFCICTFSSMSIMFEFILRRLFENERLSKIRICGFINCLDLSSAVISLYFIADWFVFDTWIGKNIIAISIVFLILRIVYIKRFLIQLLISVIMLISDVYYYNYTMKHNGFSKELTLSAELPLPVNFIVPRVIDYPFNDYVSIGIGDVILYGLLFKFLRKFDIRRGPSSKKFSDLAFVAMGIGFFIFIIFSSFRKFAMPFLLFTEPLMYISLMVYSWQQKNFMMLFKFGGEGPDDDQELDPLLAVQEDPSDQNRNNGVEMGLLI